MREDVWNAQGVIDKFTAWGRRGWVLQLPFHARGGSTLELLSRKFKVNNFCAIFSFRSLRNCKSALSETTLLPGSPQGAMAAIQECRYMTSSNTYAPRSPQTTTSSQRGRRSTVVAILTRMMALRLLWIPSWRSKTMTSGSVDSTTAKLRSKCKKKKDCWNLRPWTNRLPLVFMITIRTIWKGSHKPVLTSTGPATRVIRTQEDIAYYKCKWPPRRIAIRSLKLLVELVRDTL